MSKSVKMFYLLSLFSVQTVLIFMFLYEKYFRDNFVIFHMDPRYLIVFKLVATPVVSIFIASALQRLYRSVSVFSTLASVSMFYLFLTAVCYFSGVWDWRLVNGFSYSLGSASAYVIIGVIYAFYDAFGAVFLSSVFWVLFYYKKVFNAKLGILILPATFLGQRAMSFFMSRFGSSALLSPDVFAPTFSLFLLVYTFVGLCYLAVAGRGSVENQDDVLVSKETAEKENCSASRLRALVIALSILAIQYSTIYYDMMIAAFTETEGKAFLTKLYNPSSSTFYMLAVAGVLFTLLSYRISTAVIIFISFVYFVLNSLTLVFLNSPLVRKEELISVMTVASLSFRVIKNFIFDLSKEAMYRDLACLSYKGFIDVLGIKAAKTLCALALFILTTGAFFNGVVAAKWTLVPVNILIVFTTVLLVVFYRKKTSQQSGLNC